VLPYLYLSPLDGFVRSRNRSLLEWEASDPEDILNLVRSPHSFRHTYRSWLGETGAPMKVQQEFMRHASIHDYECLLAGHVFLEAESEWEVVEMALKPLKASA